MRLWMRGLFSPFLTTLSSYRSVIVRGEKPAIRLRIAVRLGVLVTPAATAIECRTRLGLRLRRRCDRHRTRHLCLSLRLRG